MNSGLLVLSVLLFVAGVTLISLGCQAQVLNTIKRIDRQPNSKKMTAVDTACL